VKGSGREKERGSEAIIENAEAPTSMERKRKRKGQRERGIKRTGRKIDTLKGSGNTTWTRQPEHSFIIYCKMGGQRRKAETKKKSGCGAGEDHDARPAPSYIRKNRKSPQGASVFYRKKKKGKRMDKK